MQSSYALDAGSNTCATAVTWLSAWSDVLRLYDATVAPSSSTTASLTQSLFNWIRISRWRWKTPDEMTANLRRWHDREAEGTVRVVAGSRSGWGWGLDWLGGLPAVIEVNGLRQTETTAPRLPRPRYRDRADIAERLQEVYEEAADPVSQAVP
jgi:hypothetical protein